MYTYYVLFHHIPLLVYERHFAIKVMVVQNGTSLCIHTLAQYHTYSIFLDLKVKIKILNSALIFLFIPLAFHIIVFPAKSNLDYITVTLLHYNYITHLEILLSLDVNL